MYFEKEFASNESVINYLNHLKGKKALHLIKEEQLLLDGGDKFRKPERIKKNIDRLQSEINELNKEIESLQQQTEQK